MGKQQNYQFNAEDIKLAFKPISKYIYDKSWWKNEKAREKAVKIYNKLKLEERFELAKKDSEKYTKDFLGALKNWCKKCINNKQMQILRDTIHQQTKINVDEEVPEEKQSFSINLSEQAYQLLLDKAEKEQQNLSELIISLLATKQTSESEKIDMSEKTESSQTLFTPMPDEILSQSSLQACQVNKNNKTVFELWQFAGGQCQALSRTTQKRCKRITPDLFIRTVESDNKVIEFSVCRTHNKENVKIVPAYQNI